MGVFPSPSGSPPEFHQKSVCARWRWLNPNISASNRPAARGPGTYIGLRARFLAFSGLGNAVRMPLGGPLGGRWNAVRMPLACRLCAKNSTHIWGAKPPIWGAKPPRVPYYCVPLVCPTTVFHSCGLLQCSIRAGLLLCSIRAGPVSLGIFT